MRVYRFIAGAGEATFEAPDNAVAAAVGILLFGGRVGVEQVPDAGGPTPDDARALPQGLDNWKRIPPDISADTWFRMVYDADLTDFIDAKIVDIRTALSSIMVGTMEHRRLMELPLAEALPGARQAVIDTHNKLHQGLWVTLRERVRLMNERLQRVHTKRLEAFGAHLPDWGPMKFIDTGPA